MDASLVLPIVVLVLISTVARTFHHLVFEKQFHLRFANAPWRSLIYFGLWSEAVILLFPTQIHTLFAQVTPTHYLFLTFLLVVVFPTLYHVTRTHRGSPDWLAALSPGQGMLTLGERYIFAKIGDVVFQQLVAGAMILTLAHAGISYPVIVGVFVTLFSLAHLYIFRTNGLFWGLYYTTYAALGGVAFTFLIIFVPAGITYAILLHMLFYVLSGVLFAALPRPSRAVFHDLAGVTPA
jgi:hypothetical protein